MDMLATELLALWRAFNRNQVQYIMIGGFAVNMHGYTRSTKDVDVWLKDTPDNRKRLRQSLQLLGYGDFEAIETMVFLPGWTTLYLGGVELDLMTAVKGLETIGFESCYQLAAQADLDGVMVPFLHINHLIRAKAATGRLQDLADIEQLKKIYQLP